MKNKNINFLPHQFSLLQSFIPPFGLLAVLISYLISEKDFQKHARNAMNWQITLLFLAIIALVLWDLSNLGLKPLILLWFLNLVQSVVAILKATKNKLWKYPLAFPILK